MRDSDDKMAEMIGGGGEVIDPTTFRQDTRLIQRALRNGWAVPDSVKRLVVKTMATIVSESLDERNKIAAAKTLVMADNADTRHEQAVRPVPVTNIQNNVILEQMSLAEKLALLARHEEANSKLPEA